MAEKDLSQKVLMEYPDVFADIYNALVFRGCEIVKPDELRLISTEHISNPDRSGFKQLFRDVVMENVVTGVRYAEMVEQREEEMGMCKMLDYIEEKGRTEGVLQGRTLTVIEQVIKKHARGLSINQIAEQVEEEESLVTKICNAIVECGNECTSQAVYAKLNV